MSDIYLNRRIFTNKSTVGKLIIDELELFTLEDTARRIKVHGETCIPSGTYGIEIRESSRFGRRMPYLLKVPFFEGVMIHKGNEDKNTLGCILVGMCHPSVDFIGESKTAFDKLFPKIEEALRKGPLKIHIAGGFSVDEFNKELKTVTV
jgi:hypothetical protein